MTVYSKKIVVKKIIGKSEWHTILNNWVKVHTEYYMQMKNIDKDVGYWYNERASLSLLSVAAWKSKGISLEEFTSGKGRGENKYKGRVDLWFKLNKYMALIESKQYFKRVNSSLLYTIAPDINKKLKIAVEDVRKSKTFYDKNCFGIVFFCPSYIEDKAIDIEILDKEVLKTNHDFFARIHILEKTHKVKAGDRLYQTAYLIGRKL